MFMHGTIHNIDFIGENTISSSISNIICQRRGGVGGGGGGQKWNVEIIWGGGGNS